MRLRIIFNHGVLSRLCADLGDGCVAAETTAIALRKVLNNARTSGQITLKETILKTAFGNIQMGLSGSAYTVSADINQKFLTSCGQKQDEFPAWLQHILLSQAEELSSHGYPIPDGAIIVQPA